MKKWTYLVSGILIGAVVATSGSAAAAQIKSLIGQKVSAELTVVVNGKELPNKAPVINGVTNAPVRAISDALGADLQLEGKVINITTNETVPSVSNENTNSNQNSSSGSTTTNKYFGISEKTLLELKESIENNTLKPTIEGRNQILAEIETIKKIWDNPDLTKINKQLAEYDEIIKNAEEELRLVNEALEALGK
ncbi:copper amine oxidase N-terminal domain-containing protein [Paenibacillus brevis]|uniref:Copper amine oxidase N-terminal domain-containing protein n=1 Tax=Paenibacillus brevis TaxID=2841508 RepID=A0ABS6FV48_9BACL|nr:copper amine oxidase N-terminal domain-containing protein [Paenibacillus brevis]MBU5673258.1 copper amine oxidase N-terminal domain-containing protein [Paenibacillus brevis]